MFFAVIVVYIYSPEAQSIHNLALKPFCRNRGTEFIIFFGIGLTCKFIIGLEGRPTDASASKNANYILIYEKIVYR